MPNRRLKPEERSRLNAFLEEVRSRLVELAVGDRELHFALRRRLYIRLTYDERGTPADRRRLKISKHEKQRGNCAICQCPLEIAESELHRLNAMDGYTATNTQLVHHHCHRDQQSAAGFR